MKTKINNTETLLAVCTLVMELNINNWCSFTGEYTKV